MNENIPTSGFVASIKARAKRILDKVTSTPGKIETLKALEADHDRLTDNLNSVNRENFRAALHDGNVRYAKHGLQDDWAKLIQA